MATSVEPQTPEEAAALRELAATHRRRRRWLALGWSVIVSVHTMLILHTIWHDWPLDARDLGPLAYFVGHGLAGLGSWAWGCEACAIVRPWPAGGRCRTRAGGPSAAPSANHGR